MTPDDSSPTSNRTFRLSLAFTILESFRYLCVLLVFACTLLLLLCDIILVLFWIGLWKWLAYSLLLVVSTLRSFMQEPDFGYTSDRPVVLTANTGTQTETYVPSSSDTASTAAISSRTNGITEDNGGRSNSGSGSSQDSEVNALEASIVDPVAIAVLKEMDDIATLPVIALSRKISQAFLPPRLRPKVAAKPAITIPAVVRQLRHSPDLIPASKPRTIEEGRKLMQSNFVDEIKDSTASLAWEDEMAMRSFGHELRTTNTYGTRSASAARIGLQKSGSMHSRRSNAPTVSSTAPNVPPAMAVIPHQSSSKKACASSSSQTTAIPDIWKRHGQLTSAQLTKELVSRRNDAEYSAPTFTTPRRASAIFLPDRVEPVDLLSGSMQDEAEVDMPVLDLHT